MTAGRFGNVTRIASDDGAGGAARVRPLPSPRVRCRQDIRNDNRRYNGMATRSERGTRRKSRVMAGGYWVPVQIIRRLLRTVNQLPPDDPIRKAVVKAIERNIVS